MNQYILKRICGLFILVWTGVLAFFTVTLVRYGILPMVWRGIVLGILWILTLLLWATIVSSRSRSAKIFSMLLSLLFSVAFAYGLSFIYHGIHFWENSQDKTEVGSTAFDTENKAINIYIAGVDDEGDIRDYGRCDVNILLTIHPATHKMLLTTTPRDAYVAIDGDPSKMDKLTHAGVYGPKASMRALEKLYGIEIPYYCKVNFASFEKLIDAVGGVEIDIPEDFVAWDGQAFTKGLNRLDGAKALEFVRERNAFAEGDLARGDHQQQVLSALFNKMMSPSSVLHIKQIADSLEGKFLTNLPTKKLMGIANGFLKNRGKWSMERQIVYGEGQIGLPSYAMPANQLYMMPIDPDVLERAKEKIREVME